MSDADSSEQISQRLRRWFWNGPSGPYGEDGTLGFLIGCFVWWRMLAVGGIVMVSLGLVFYLTTFTEQPIAIVGMVVSWQIGTFTGMYLVKVGPKYNVERNY